MRRLSLLALVATFGTLAACGGEEATSEPDAAPATVTVSVTETVEAGATEETTTAPAEEPTTTEAAKPKPKPQPTVSQQNAIESAQSYLDFSAFSKEGLIEQLVYEGFSKKDAAYAVKAIKPNWNAQAAKAAQQYLDYSSFSRQGLIDQLMFEGYTRAQAEYGARKVGL
jgi:hypothetical protein